MQYHVAYEAHGDGLCVAFLSSQPVDVRPEWRKARHVIQAGDAG